MWKVISSKEVYTHPPFTLLEDLIELPDGQQINWVRYQDTNDSVTVLAKNVKGEYLVQKEFCYPQQETLLELPGGYIDEDEEAEVAANRELAEEAGYRAENLELIGEYYHTKRRSTAKMLVYLGTGLHEANGQKDPGEEITAFWLTAEAIDKMIANGQILSARFLSSWAFYTAKHRTISS